MNSNNGKPPTPAYFGRAWRIRVFPAATGGEPLEISSDTKDSNGEALRVKFRLEQAALVTYWSADIEIFNWLPAMRAVIARGDYVTIEAGYQNPGTGLIFSGRVFQPIWERVSSVDYRLTLHCLIGLWEDDVTGLSTEIPANTNNYAAVNQIAGLMGVPVQKLDSSLETTGILPRPRPYVGSPSAFLNDVATTNQMSYWLSWKGVNIRPLAPDPNQPAIPELVYSPPFAQPTSDAGTKGLGKRKATVLGSPQQNEMGVSFRVLLDSDVDLGMLVKLEAVVVAQIRVQYYQFIPQLDGQGIYIVSRIVHEGDTRGDQWHTSIDGVTREQYRAQASLFGA